MIKRLKAAAYPRMKNEAYYTPPHAVHSLLAFDNEVRVLSHLGRKLEIWEPAAGRGDISTVLAKSGRTVFSSDFTPPEKLLCPVARLNFLSSSGPAGKPYAIVTNPPYGFQNREATAFVRHGHALMRSGLCAVMALLLPFKFDASFSRNELVGDHPYFIGKVTVKKRIRWLNLPQSENDPMGCHAWYVWSSTNHHHRTPAMVVR